MPTPSLPHEFASVAAVLPRHETASVDKGPRRSSLNASPAVWLDLTLLNRTALTQVLERYALPLEVITYFQLKFQSPKVIAADRALFVVMCIVTPSPRLLFVPHELKLCITPTLVAGLCDRGVRAQPQVESIFARLAAPPIGGVAQCVWDLLDGVIASYETVVMTLSNGALARKGTEEQGWWTQRGNALATALQQHRVGLRNVTHAGRKVGLDDHTEDREQWETRIDRMLRTIDDRVPMTHEKRTPLQRFS